MSNTSGIPSAHTQVLDLIEDLVSLQLSNLHMYVTSRLAIDIELRFSPSIHPVSTNEVDRKMDRDYVRAVVSGDSDSAMRRRRDKDKVLVIETFSDRTDAMYIRLMVLMTLITNYFTGPAELSVN